MAVYDNWKIPWPKPPEYYTILQNEQLDAVFYEMCRTAPDSVILCVHEQQHNLLTLQFLREHRYPLQQVLDDGGCTWWVGIVLNSVPRPIWGDVRHLKIERHPCGNMVSAQFRAYKYKRYRKRRKILLKKHKNYATGQTDSCFSTSGHLSPDHQMDFVVNLRYGKRIG